MTVRVTLIDGEAVIEIRASGQATRREAGWATEHARELSLKPTVRAILADCSEAEQQKSPKLSAEIIENFLFALERPVPTAYVVPRMWDEAYQAAVLKEMIDVPPNARFFPDRESARSWLTALQAA